MWDKDPVVAHWAFNEGWGNVTADSVYGLEGQIVGAEWVDGFSGKSGDKALHFDGSDYVQLPLDVIIRDEYKKSLCAWIKSNSPWPGSTRILQWYDGRNTAMLATEGWGSVCRITGECPMGSAGSYGTQTSESVCETERWHHIC